MEQAVQKRRDPRYVLKGAVAEFDDPRDGQTRWCGRLVTLSAAGIAIELNARFSLEQGTVIDGVVLQVGECRLEGSVAVKNMRAGDRTVSEIGGLFYPATPEEARMLMALIAGMEAIDLEAIVR